jgi:hypothetical protein
MARGAWRVALGADDDLSDVRCAMGLLRFVGRGCHLLVASLAFSVFVMKYDIRQHATTGGGCTCTTKNENEDEDSETITTAGIRDPTVRNYN